MNLTEEMSKYKSILNESWNKEMKTPESKKGMFKGKTKAELRSQLADLKKRSERLHKNDEKEPASLKTKIKELEFALRAKNNFGKVNEDKKYKPQFDEKGMCLDPYFDENDDDEYGFDEETGKEYKKTDGKVNEGKDLKDWCPECYGDKPDMANCQKCKGTGTNPNRKVRPATDKEKSEYKKAKVEEAFGKKKRYPYVDYNQRGCDEEGAMLCAHGNRVGYDNCHNCGGLAKEDKSDLKIEEAKKKVTGPFGKKKEKKVVKEASSINKTGKPQEMYASPQTFNISFPKRLLFDDYHEIEYFADRLSKILGKTIKFKEGSELKDDMYVGIFWV